jgi:FKBP-type peptidyl-prolyl cis-trans isomerase FkpA
MKKIALILCLCTLFACRNNNSHDGFIKTASNFHYKIIPSSTGGDTILAGDIVKVHLLQYIDDSLMNDTHWGMPEYIKIDSSLREFDFSEILPLMKKNDSAICLFSTAEILKRSSAATHPPHFLEEGKYIRVFLKVVDKFRVDSVALADYQMEKLRFDSINSVKENEGFKSAEDIFAILIKSLKKPVEKLDKGVYVHMLEKGRGAKIKQGDSVAVVYKGMLADGALFEETTAASPFVFRAGQQETIKGLDVGISSLSFGDKAKIFIPAKFAYGAQKASDKIPPFSNLVFEVTINKP